MIESLPIASSLTAEWFPLWKAAGIFFTTFVLEDAAAVGAGLLLATGQMTWPAAFTACFLGIWMGDAGLYALARFAGRAWFEKSPWRGYSARVDRSENGSRNAARRS
jgi:membrane protein DedA with SNARE-associated domain